MGRHVRATHHEAHVAEGAGVDDLLVVRLGDSVELAGLGVVDEVEEAREGIAEIEATPAAVADVEDALRLGVQLFPVVEVRVVPLDRVAHRRVETAFAHLCPLCRRSEEHTSELQSLMRISYAVFCLKKKN